MNFSKYPYVIYKKVYNKAENKINIEKTTSNFSNNDKHKNLKKSFSQLQFKKMINTKKYLTKG